MKILFLGGKTAGCIGLLTLLAKGRWPDVVAYSDDVDRLAKAYGLRGFHKLANAHGDYELIVSVHGREIVPSWRLVTYAGGINVHPCLWKYKGASPIKRALEAGETKFSVGAHRMTEKVDEGEVLVEKFMEVDNSHYGENLAHGYTVEAIYQKLYPLYSIVLSEALEKIIA